MNQHSFSFKDQRGFTLIETSISLVFLMVALMGVASILVYAVNYDSAAAIRAGGLAVAQRSLERLRATPFDECVSSSETVSVGKPGTGLQTYTLDTTVTSMTSTLKTIKVVVTPQGKSTSEGQYSGKEGWKYGQVIVYTMRTTVRLGPNLG